MEPSRPHAARRWDLASRLRLIALVGSLMILAAWALVRPPRPFKPSLAEARASIIEVVAGQVMAMRDSDFRLAWDHLDAASRSGVSPGEFEAMIQQNHPALPRSTRIGFGLAHDNGSQAAIAVLVWLDGGAPREYLFLLSKERKVWRVSEITEGHNGLLLA